MNNFRQMGDPGSPETCLCFDCKAYRLRLQLAVAQARSLAQLEAQLEAQAAIDRASYAPTVSTDSEGVPTTH